MHLNNLLSKVAIVVTYTLLFFLAVYFGKPATMVDGVFFLVGLLLGWVILEADESYFHKYYLEEEQMSLEQKPLITRSVLFMLALIPLGFYLLTSTGSVIGVGVFVSIVSGLALEMYVYRSQIEVFHQRFLSQLQKKLSESDLQKLVYMAIFFSVLYGTLVIFAGR